MNCSMCHLMYNLHRNKVVYACGIAACEECLTKRYSTVPRKCILSKHQKCIKKEVNQQFRHNTFDKKIKVVFLGNSTSGKTTLITTMRYQGEKPNVRKSVSNDVVPVSKIVNNLKVQYALWDTASQASIFASSFDSNFKDSKIQVIVFKKGGNLRIVKQFADETQQHSQNPHIVIVQNKYQNDEFSSESELRKYLVGIQYKYFWINCRLIAQVSQLWDYFNNKCLGFKQNQSKIQGFPNSSLRQEMKKADRKLCCI